jgi:hypothetical protein
MRQRREMPSRFNGPVIPSLLRLTFIRGKASGEASAEKLRVFRIPDAA